MLVQLLVGVPLEMVHGSFRLGLVYMAGVLAGKWLSLRTHHSTRCFVVVYIS